MLRKVIIIVTCIVVITLFVFLIFQGCSNLLLKQIYEDIGTRDWRVILTNGFEIHKLNGNDIILVKNGWTSDSNIVVASYINSYCYNDIYIGLWCAKDGPSDLLGLDLEKDAFFIIDTQENTLVGPLTKTEYENYCLEKSISGLNEWISTKPTPDEAIFN